MNQNTELTFLNFSDSVPEDLDATRPYSGDFVIGGRPDRLIKTDHHLLRLSDVQTHPVPEATATNPEA